jgi:hypothetical protein
MSKVTQVYLCLFSKTDDPSTTDFGVGALNLLLSYLMKKISVDKTRLYPEQIRISYPQYIFFL